MATKTIEQFQASIEDAHELRTLFAELIDSSIQRNFDLGGRYGNDTVYGGGSNKWTPSLASLGRSGKTKSGRQGKGMTLIDSGQLRASIDVVAIAKNIRITVGKVYGAAHNFGYTFKHYVLIARPYVVIQREDLNDMAELAASYWEKKYS